MREYKVTLTVVDDTDGSKAEAQIEVGTTVEVITEGFTGCLGHVIGVRVERSEVD